VYDNTLSFTHYESLKSKEVELELIRSIEITNNTIAFDGQAEMIYIGPQVLSRYYRLELVGSPADTILNPLQRDYIGSVTFDFLDSFSDQKPSLVEVVGQDFSRRMKESDLRGGRQLQFGVITAESFVYGIGDDADAFFDAIEDAFRSNEQQYRSQLQKEQYRPGAINEDEDFGAVFKDLIRVSVKTNETSSGGSDDTTESDDLTWIIVFSVVLGLSFLFLVYRICKDCFLVKDGEQIKGESLTERKERKEKSLAERKERKESGGTVEEHNGPSNYFYGWRNSDQRAKEAPKDKSSRSVKKEGSNGSSPRGSGKNASRDDRSSNEKRPNSKKGDRVGSKSPKAHTGKKKPSGSQGKPSSSKTESTNRDTSDHKFLSPKSAGKRTPGTGSTASVGSTSKREPRRHISASKSFDNSTKRRLRSSSPPSEKKTASKQSNSRSKSSKKAEVKGFLGPGNSTSPKKPV
jgi:hypothetical protein